MTIATPSTLSACSSVRMASVLPSSSVSVISSSSRCAANPVSFSAEATSALTLPAVNCAGDRFTAMLRCSGQLAAVRHASRNTHAPILSISCKSSATGMNISGGISLPSSVGSRISASKPIRRRIETSNIGW
jgi:hypothetical protein